MNAWRDFIAEHPATSNLRKLPSRQLILSHPRTVQAVHDRCKGGLNIPDRHDNGKLTLCRQSTRFVASLGCTAASSCLKHSSVAPESTAASLMACRTCTSETPEAAAENDHEADLSTALSTFCIILDSTSAKLRLRAPSQYSAVNSPKGASNAYLNTTEESHRNKIWRR